MEETKSISKGVPRVLVRAKKNAEATRATTPAKNSNYDKGSWDKAWEKGPWDKGHWSNRK